MAGSLRDRSKETGDPLRLDSMRSWQFVGGALGPLWEFLHDLFQGVGEDEIVEVDRVDRGTVRTAMDSGLAEVDGLGTFRLQLLVQDQNAVEPEPRVPFVLVLRPMDVHRQLVPFADREIRLPVRAVAPEVPRTVLDERPAAFLWLDPPGHHVVVSRRRRSLP